MEQNLIYLIPVIYLNSFLLKTKVQVISNWLQSVSTCHPTHYSVPKLKRRQFYRKFGIDILVLILTLLTKKELSLLLVLLLLDR